MSGNLLAGRTALIVGAGRGIGAAISNAFADEGANLFLVSRTKNELEQVASRCRSLGRECFVETADVSERGDVARLIPNVLSRLGHIDTLVNAAGIYGPIGAVSEIDLGHWSRAVQVNLMGTLYTCHDVLPSMVERGSGSIINFSGGGATSPLPRFSAYGASKAAVVRLTETLAREVAPNGVRVNSIAPGAVDTTLQDEVLKAGSRAGDLYSRISALRESGAGATPISVPAELAVFLASDDSKGLTGRLISAPHDPWREWTHARIAALANTQWYTLRRLDPFTVSSLPDSTP